MKVFNAKSYENDINTLSEFFIRKVLEHFQYYETDIKTNKARN